MEWDRRVYLSEMCQPISSVADRHHLRSAVRGHLAVLRYRLTTAGRRAFSFAGPSAWDSLPAYLKNETLTLGSFKGFEGFGRPPLPVSWFPAGSGVDQTQTLHKHSQKRHRQVRFFEARNARKCVCDRAFPVRHREGAYNAPPNPVAGSMEDHGMEKFGYGPANGRTCREPNKVTAVGLSPRGAAGRTNGWVSDTAAKSRENQLTCLDISQQRDEKFPEV